MNTLIILPTYNEAGNIEGSIKNIKAVNPDYHILVVDDSSPDGTADIAQKLAETIPGISVRIRPAKQGLGAAYKEVLTSLQSEGIYDHIIHMDADGSHDPKYLPTMVDALQKHDLVIGSRYTKGGGIDGWEKSRYLLSNAGNFYARNLMRLPIRDLTAGYIGMTHDFLKTIDFSQLSAAGYAYLMEFKYRCVKYHDAKVKEIPIIFLERREGESKISGNIIGEGLRLPWKIILKSKAEEKILPCPVCKTEKATFYCAKNKYRIYMCASCGYGFVSPTPPTTQELYDENYFRNTQGESFGYVDYDKDKEAMRSVFDDSLLKLEKLTAGRKLMDIGAATGYFLDIAKKRNWQTYGSEISEFAGAEAQKRGHIMHIGELTNAQNLDTQDVITMWDVLEHVTSPREYVKKALELLNPDGVLFVNTVNISSLWSKFMGKRWHLIVPPEHLNYFSTESLKQLLKQEGFTVLEARTLGKKFSLAYIFKTLHSWQGLMMWRYLASFFDKPIFRTLQIPINLRDNIYVIARKSQG